MKRKKIIAFTLSAAALTLILTACGSKKSESAESSRSADVSQSAETKATEPVNIKLGVVGSIYEDLWAPAQEALKDEGGGSGDRTVLRLCDAQ